MDLGGGAEEGALVGELSEKRELKRSDERACRSHNLSQLSLRRKEEAVETPG